MAKAAAVGLIPALGLASMGGYRPVLVVVVGMPTLFLAGAAVWEVYRELNPVAEPPPPPKDGPEGIHSQEEAARLIADLNATYWGGES